MAESALAASQLTAAVDAFRDVPESGPEVPYRVAPWVV